MTVRAALEVLWNGGAGEDDDGGLSTAQSILDAADITLPTGDLANGVYDAFGAFYSLPEWIVADPENVAPAGAGADAEDEDKSLGRGGASSQEEEEDSEELLRRREEKGKAVVAEADLIKVRARLSDRGGPDVVVSLGKEESVRLLGRHVFEEAGVSCFPLTNILLSSPFLKIQSANAGTITAHPLPPRPHLLHGQDAEGERVARRTRLARRPRRQRIGVRILIWPLPGPLNLEFGKKPGYDTPLTKLIGS